MNTITMNVNAVTDTITIPRSDLSKFEAGRFDVEFIDDAGRLVGVRAARVTCRSSTSQGHMPPRKRTARVSFEFV